MSSCIWWSAKLERDSCLVLLHSIFKSHKEWNCEKIHFTSGMFDKNFFDQDTPTILKTYKLVRFLKKYAPWKA